MRLPLAGTGLRRYTRKHCVHDRDAARAEILRLEQVIRRLEAAAAERGQHVAQLEADAVDVSVERQLRARAEEAADEFEARYVALKSRLANENAITVPPWRRPVDEDDTATEPAGIDVRTLREAFNPSAA
jgi:hypothetical protein